MSEAELRWSAGLVIAQWDDGDACQWAETGSAVLVARAWLAEHPADDAEPVTAERLEAVGFRRRGEDWCSPPFPRTDDVVWRLAWCSHLRSPGQRLWELSFPGCTSSLGYDLATMGDLRRLCNALRIPLTQPCCLTSAAG